MWLKVLNTSLERFFYPGYGMEEHAEVTTNGKVQVPDDVGEQLLEHPSGDFEPTEEDN